MCCRISNAGDWAEFADLPLVGTISTNDGARNLVISSYWPADRRGAKSYFASANDKSKTVFLFDVIDDGLLLQVVDNTAKAVPLGLCAPVIVLADMAM